MLHFACSFPFERPSLATCFAFAFPSRSTCGCGRLARQRECAAGTEGGACLCSSGQLLLQQRSSAGQSQERAIRMPAPTSRVQTLSSPRVETAMKLVFGLNPNPRRLSPNQCPPRRLKRKLSIETLEFLAYLTCPQKIRPARVAP